MLTWSESIKKNLIKTELNYNIFMTFEDLTEEFLHERATKEDIFEVEGTRFSAIYNEGLNVYKLFYVDSNVDPYSEDYEWIEVSFDEEEN